MTDDRPALPDPFALLDEVDDPADLPTVDEWLAAGASMREVDPLVCGCRAEIIGDEVHVFPCRLEHGEQWERLLPGMLAELGVKLAVEVVNP